MAITQFDGPHAFLSNFYPSPVRLDGLEYPTVEHAFQAAKTHDPEARRRIRTAPTPGQAKRLGRQVQLRADWEQVKVGIMRSLLVQKFAEPELKALLRATGSEPLIEGNTWNDRIWGCTWDGKTWIGQNHLGKLLMSLRAEK